MFIVNIFIQNFNYINLFHNFVNHLYLVTYDIHKTYFILTFGIILDITYIKIHTHIEYSINHIENGNTISYTVIYDFNIAINISYLNIMTSKSYKTIGEVNLIGYVDTPETSYSDVKTSELYNTIGDTDISVYVSIIMEELFETIGDILCIEYMAPLEASNANIEASNSDIAIRKTNEIKYDILVDIKFGRNRAMWWSADHHIERGCESTSSLFDSWIKDITVASPCWLKLRHAKESMRSTASASATKTTIIIFIDRRQ